MHKNLIIDSHTHLDLLEKRGIIPDLSALTAVITISTEQHHAQTLQKYLSNNVFRTVGIHPDHAHQVSYDWQWLDDTCTGKGVVAIGEIGLDKYRTSEHLEVQIAAFEAQVQIAMKHDLPIVIHSRDAEDETLAILKKYRPRGVLHCFTGSHDFAQQAIELGLYISFSGIVTFKKSHLPEIAKTIPLDRILVETDAPYLSPEPYRGQINKPEYVRHTAEFLAQYISCDINQFAYNTYDLFTHISK